MSQPEQKKEPTQKKNGSDVVAVKEQLLQKDAVIADYTNQLKRLQAEFENYLKRADKERQEFITFANENLIKKLLIVVDDVDRALEQLKKSGADEAIVNGIAMVAQGFHNTLATEGLKQIDAKGQKFDPFVHEVVTCINRDDCPENTVVEELQKGYLLGSRAIRFSKVIISKQTTKTEKPKESGA
ncbi:nucleotide exchange factor GrpE [Candidatus Woesearchaeota archaeon]|nr:nucleotide exchange factor GrpE [Candidatus Woesearchaeota archaeon]